MIRRFAALTFAALALAAAPALAANPQVEFDTTLGKIRIELYPDAAPKTVANFLEYVKSKGYDGTQFHRVIDGFMPVSWLRSARAANKKPVGRAAKRVLCAPPGISELERTSL